MKKKKICYVTTLSLTIDSFFIPQLKKLAEEGFDVTVITSPDEGLQDRLGAEIKHLPVEMPRGMSVGGSLRAVSALTKLFKQEKFDLVQYSTPNAAFYASIAAKKAKIPVRNYHLMGLRFLGAKGIMRTVLKLFEKTACKNSTHIECVSPSNLQLCKREKLFPDGKGVVVWNGSSGGVDLQRFDVAKRDEFREEKRKQYGFEKEDLQQFYSEFAEYEPYCRFQGCSHINEPNCGVKDAVSEGHVSKLRYENYKLLYQELKDVKKY